MTNKENFDKHFIDLEEIYHEREEMDWVYVAILVVIAIAVAIVIGELWIW